MTIEPVVLALIVGAAFALGFACSKPASPRPAADPSVIAALLWGYLEPHVRQKPPPTP